MKMSDRILQARKQARLTQKELGVKIGVTPSSISRWENGEQQPAADALFLLAQELGISLDEIIAGQSHSNDADDNVHQPDPMEVANNLMDDAFDSRLAIDLYEHVKRHIDSATPEELEHLLMVMGMIESRVKRVLRIRGAPYDEQSVTAGEIAN